jgi:dTDP-N-acetylfucosamine:lipid II N-acetylfucosaminyltransferase
MMAPQKIVHCMHAEKFIEPFIDLVESNFDSSQHVFLVRQSEKFPTKSRANVKILSECIGSIWKMCFYIWNIRNVRKIILHGLFHKEIFLILFFQPWLLKKCYWVMWGGDVYRFQHPNQSLKSNLFEMVRASVIRRIGHFVTQIQGDYELVKSLYRSSGVYHNCFMYTSNLYYEYKLGQKAGKTINILVGNSAVPTNNHLEVLKKLVIFKGMDIKIFVPLSYGSLEYARTIVDFGVNEFGDKFISLTEFIPFKEYLELLSEIDIAIFNHTRQQALGNTTTLLGLGKKVYMRSEVTTRKLFSDLGVITFDVNHLELSPISEEDAKKNRETIAEHFSEKILIKQLGEIFQ